MTVSPAGSTFFGILARCHWTEHTGAFMKRILFVTAALVMLAGPWAPTRAVVHAASVLAPRFEVDAFWPKPLPNHWILGQSIGVSADAQGHIWIVHRVGSLEAVEPYTTPNPSLSKCC